MVRFQSCREAKEFLVGRIVEEARLENVALSETERQMLYFTETGWAPVGMWNASERFDAECDQAEYEAKVARLARNARKRDRRDPEKGAAWSSAIRSLLEEDHYLSVIIGQAGISARPPGDLLKLWGTGLAVVACLMGLMAAADHFGVPLTKDFFGLVLWAVVAFAAVAYLALRVMVGKERAHEILERLLSALDRVLM